MRKHAAREAFIESESSERIKRALRGRVRVSEQIFHRGEKEYYKLDGRERWLGPASVLFQIGKVTYIRHGSFMHRILPNRLNKINVSDAESNSSIANKLVVNSTGEKQSEPIAINEEHNEMQQHEREAVGEIATPAVPRRRAVPEIVRRSVRVYNKEQNENIPAEVCVTLVPRSQLKSPESLVAKDKELQKLKEFNVYDYEEVPDVGQKTISTRFVMTIRNSEYRARLVARGFEESQYVHSDSPTIGKCAIRLFLCIAVALCWPVKTIDIKSAFLQGRELDRDVFIKPPPEAFIWKLRRCLYGLNDAARQFYISINHALKSQGCIQSQLDPSLFYFKSDSNTVEGILVSHIDDFLHGGSIQFDERIMNNLRTHFLAGKLEEKNFTYVGMEIQQNDEGIILSQNDYIDAMSIVEISPERAKQKSEPLTKEERTQYRSAVKAVNWVVQSTRPDVAFDMLMLSMLLKIFST